MEEPAVYTRATSGVQKFIDEVKDLRSFIDHTEQQLEAAKKNLEIAQIKCTHINIDFTDAFKCIGVTHKEIYECEICGYRVTV